MIGMVRGRMLAAGIGLALAAAACGGAAASGGSGGGSGPATVSVRQVSGVGTIYTNAQGMALYSPAQEASGKIMCTGSCTSVWIPLAPPANGSPTKGPGVAGTLSIITRPDGTKQVALNGAPLYRFYLDSAPGAVNGNGVNDSFGGVSFTWHVEASTAVTTSPSSSGYGYGH
jgi:predicted lipoprotein with Yx(FWY)xxD motif